MIMFYGVHGTAIARITIMQELNWRVAIRRTSNTGVFAVSNQGIDAASVAKQIVAVKMMKGESNQS